MNIEKIMERIENLQNQILPFQEKLDRLIKKRDAFCKKFGLSLAKTPIVDNDNDDNRLTKKGTVDKRYASAKD